MPNNIVDLFDSIPDVTDIYSKWFDENDMSEYEQAFKNANIE
ncbi:hypothetical protein [Clostridium beijerinckii]|jgi:hypothetical protein|nr:hypothetical protein [Clostridium beijerinckii]NRU52613.1 hypothetical protein [Clostridium beijerinckii]NYC68656.1 hypothetical protein [Clostridium beijerinckii]NYC91805.1 hypothetical protein [Clostridium beijerinckii]